MRRALLNAATLVLGFALVLGPVSSASAGAQGSLPPRSVTTARGPTTSTSSTTATTAGPGSTSDRSAVSVSPAVIQDTTNPGATYVTQVTIANLTDGPMAFHGTVRPMDVGSPVDEAHRSAYDASGWFHVTAPDFLLTSQQAKAIDVQVAVPKNAEPGDHYATVFFESFVPNEAAAAQATVVNARIGVQVLLTINGDIHKEVQLVDALRVPAVDTEATPTDFSMTVRNSGNVHVEPVGMVRVKDVFGRQVAMLRLSTGLSLPGTQRTYAASWQHGMRVGIFKAYGLVTLADGQQELRAQSRWFVVLPLVVVVPPLVAIVVVGLFISRRRRARRRRLRRAMAGPPADRSDLAGDGSLPDAEGSEPVRADHEAEGAAPGQDDRGARPPAGGE